MRLIYHTDVSSETGKWLLIIRLKRTQRFVLCDKTNNTQAAMETPAAAAGEPYWPQKGAEIAKRILETLGVRRHVGALKSGDASPHSRFRQKTASFSAVAAHPARLAQSFAPMARNAMRFD